MYWSHIATGDSEGGGFSMGLMTLLEGPMLLAAASAGNVDVIRRRLERNPERVCEDFI